METDTNNEDDDELRFEEADDEDAETPPSTEDVAMHIPKNLRDSLGSGRRDAAPAGVARPLVPRSDVWSVAPGRSARWKAFSTRNRPSTVAASGGPTWR